MQKNLDKYVSIKGARQNNLKNIDLEVPRNKIVVFTGVSGSGKSSLAFGTIYAEAQRRYLESVSPYARRLFNQMSIPDVDSVEGLPPAVALQQQKGNSSSRSTIGSLTTISNSLRMLYSRAGDYPKNMDILYADSFSPNTPEGACPDCHGLGHKLDTTEKLMVPDTSLSIGEKALKWPGGWHAKNLRDMLTTMGVDVSTPWKKLPKKTRDWILYTDETPTVPVYANFSLKEVKAAIKNEEEPSYMGNFTGVRDSILSTHSNTQSAVMRKRVQKFLIQKECPSCKGQGLKESALKVKFAGYDIVQISNLKIVKLYEILSKARNEKKKKAPEVLKVIETICADVTLRLKTIIGLGLEHLTLDRKTPSLSSGELQRLRLSTQLRSELFGVVYVLDEPSAGLHGKDIEALIDIFKELKEKGNTVFIVEHNKEIIKMADWIVDIGPMAGTLGGEIIYNGPIKGLKSKKNSQTAKHLYSKLNTKLLKNRKAKQFLEFKDINVNNIEGLEFKLPLEVMVNVVGVSGAGKSSLISKAVNNIISNKLKEKENSMEMGELVGGIKGVKRVVEVNQDPIGRTPRSNIATYTGVFDYIRRLFSKTALAKKKSYSASRFSFNVTGGRCENCSGEGYVMVELLFLPSVYSPCPVCEGKRYNPQTLAVKYKNKSIADILELTVDEAIEFFSKEKDILKGLSTLKSVGLNYIKLGQSATEISGGEAQRVKLASELQAKRVDHTLYLLDEPSAGLHPMDVEKLFIQLQELIDRGNSVVVIDHNEMITRNSDWKIELGPGAGDKGGEVISSSAL